MTTYTFTLGPSADNLIIPCGSSGAHVIGVLNTGSSNIWITNRPQAQSPDAIYADIIAGNASQLAPGANMQLSVTADSSGTYLLSAGVTGGSGALSVTVLS